MRPKVYDQYDAAVKLFSASAVMYEGDHVANITIKYGVRCTAFVHWLGTTMTRGTASGGGYDKATAAVYSALKTLQHSPRGEYEREDRRDVHGGFPAFVTALDGVSGADWDRALRAAGFDVLRVVS